MSRPGGFGPTGPKDNRATTAGQAPPADSAVGKIFPADTT
jgi:hypothetical protein